MVNQTIKLVYENGMFRPLNEPEMPITEGDQVSLQVPVVEERTLSPQEITRLAVSVLEGLAEEELREMEKVALDRSNFSNSCPI